MGTRIVENEEKYEIKPNKKVAPEPVAFLTGFGVIIVPIIEMVFLLLATLGKIHLGALSILMIMAVTFVLVVIINYSFSWFTYAYIVKKDDYWNYVEGNIIGTGKKEDVYVIESLEQIKKYNGGIKLKGKILAKRSMMKPKYLKKVQILQFDDVVYNILGDYCEQKNTGK